MLTSPMLLRAGLVVAALALAMSSYVFGLHWPWADAVSGWITMTTFPLPSSFLTPRLAPTLLVALKILVAGALAVNFPLTSSLAPVAGLTYQLWRQLTSTGGVPSSASSSLPHNPLDPLHLAIQFAVAGAVARCVTSSSSHRRDRRRNRRRHHGIKHLGRRLRSFWIQTVRTVQGGIACVLRALYRSVERLLVRADPYLRALEDRYPGNDEAEEELLPDDFDGHDDEEEEEASFDDDDDDDEEYVDEEEADEEDEVAEVILHRGGRALVGNDRGWVLRRYVVELHDNEEDDDGEEDGAGHNEADDQHGSDPPQHPPSPDGPPEDGDEEPPRQEDGGMGADNVEEIVDSSDDEQDS
jgi:hypothetical protein